MDTTNKTDSIQDSTDTGTPIVESEKAADVSICNEPLF